MINKYPLWKNISVVLMLLVAALYALPNLYGDDHAVEVTGVRGAQVSTAVLSKVESQLAQRSIAVKSITLQNDTLLVRLQDHEQQLAAKAAIKQALNTQYIVALNFAPTTPAWLSDIGASAMRLGLDLRGGIHFLMEVDMREVVAKATTQIATDIRAGLRGEKIRYAGLVSLKEGVLVRFNNADASAAGQRYIRQNLPQYMVQNQGELNLKVTLSEEQRRQIREDAVSQNITILRNRVNELGVAEPIVQRQGAERIVVQLPGVQDSARAKQILGATATLEFRMVDMDKVQRGLLRQKYGEKTDIFDVRRGGKTALKREVILSGEHITNAQVAFDEYNQPQVSIDLDAEGGSMMAAATKNAIGQLMAALFTEYKPTGDIDDQGRVKLVKTQDVISQATIQARLGRSFRITGLDYEEAQNLALLLRAGALKAPIQIVEERTIGPSMGQQNIEYGMQAMLWGLAMVVLFMFVYYRQFGVVANIVLMLNLVMIVGLMSMIPGATLTMPGIAGMVLTVGMAVDGNVLIFERIREELRLGKRVQQSISEGYGNAFSTIADANITTFLTALILFTVGTGAVKGFAVTLMIGIATSMFTVIVVSRALVNVLWGGKKLKSLSI
jgi:preprotein translocase subunit SecD